MLYGLEPGLQKRFERHGAYKMFQEMKLIFQSNAHVERYKTSDKYFAYKMEESSMVNISMLIISTILFTLDLSVSSVLRPCLYMLGSSSLTQVFRMCKTVLHPLYVNVESITPDHHVVSQN